MPCHVLSAADFWQFHPVSRLPAAGDCFIRLFTSAASSDRSTTVADVAELIGWRVLREAGIWDACRSLR